MRAVSIIADDVTVSIAPPGDHGRQPRKIQDAAAELWAESGVSCVMARADHFFSLINQYSCLTPFSQHHPEGGVHGLVEYVGGRISQWTHLQTRSGHYPLSVATKATILGHTLRGAFPTPVDKTMAQLFAYEAIRRLIEQPEQVIGCMLAYREPGTIQPIPLHAVAPKPFDWELFARMHGTELV